MGHSLKISMMSSKDSTTNLCSADTMVCKKLSWHMHKMEAIRLDSKLGFRFSVLIRKSWCFALTKCYHVRAFSLVVECCTLLCISMFVKLGMCCISCTCTCLSKMDSHWWMMRLSNIYKSLSGRKKKKLIVNLYFQVFSFHSNFLKQKHNSS